MLGGVGGWGGCLEDIGSRRGRSQRRLFVHSIEGGGGSTGFEEGIENGGERGGELGRMVRGSDGEGKRRKRRGGTWLRGHRAASRKALRRPLLSSQRCY